jgi:dTDP-glucose 4,6-dehydratase
MRILVTGGAGFIGSHFVKNLVAGSVPDVSEIIVLDKLTYSGNRSNLDEIPDTSFQFIVGDICDEDLVRKTTKSIDLIVNFAAESHVDRSIDSSKSFFATNVLGTQNLLENARINNVRTFIQISTDEVYGSIESGSWDEEYPLRPNSPYAASKASADLLARSFYKTYGMDVRITRCSNNYGSNQYPEKIIPLFVTNLLQKKSIPLYGNGSNIRDWLHVSDHCQGINLVLEKGRPGEIYNIGGGQEISNLELTHLILKSMNVDESVIEFVHDRRGHDFRYSLNYEKISQQLQYYPKISFEKGISETIAWYKTNTTWWKNLLN